MTDSDLDMPMTEAPRTSWSIPQPTPRLLAEHVGPARIVIKHGGQVYRSCPKTAHHRGGISWIWITIPTVRQMAFDLLSIPAMSAETERVFSDTKLMIPPQRTRLGADIVEAQKCEKAWLKAGL
jgi:hypothetical protein